MVIFIEILVLVFSPMVLGNWPEMVISLTFTLTERLPSTNVCALWGTLLSFLAMNLRVNWDGSSSDDAPAVLSPRLQPLSPERVRAAVAALRCR